jgi:small subunit ribosomal protein S3
MGQKVNPIGFRLGVIRDWTAKWYSGNQHYTENLLSDLALRSALKEKLKNAAVSSIVIERPAQNVSITVHTARPGIVIGKKGEDIEKLRQELTRLAGRPVQLAVEEVRQPELDAQLVAENVAQQLEKRIMFRRAMKRAVTNAMRLRALGIKIMVAGRLNGAEIARTEWYREGRVPLHTLRADIDYGFTEAHTTYGAIGVKVWVFKGEVFDKDAPRVDEAEAQKTGAGTPKPGPGKKPASAG